MLISGLDMNQALSAFREQTESLLFSIGRKVQSNSHPGQKREKTDESPNADRTATEYMSHLVEALPQEYKVALSKPIGCSLVLELSDS